MAENNVTPVISAPVPMTPFQEFWHYFKQNKGAVVGLIYIVIMLLIAALAGVLAPHAPNEQFREFLLTPPVWQEGGSWSFILGTDDVGRDILSRLMYFITRWLHCRYTFADFRHYFRFNGWLFWWHR